MTQEEIECMLVEICKMQEYLIKQSLPKTYKMYYDVPNEYKAKEGEWVETFSYNENELEEAYNKLMSELLSSK